MKLKVCHITTAHQINDVRIFIKECTSLAKEGHEVCLVSTGTHDQTINQVSIVNAGTRSASIIGRMTVDVCKVFIKALQQKSIIYHFHDPECLFIGLLLRLFGKKVIYDVHEDLPRQILSKPYIPKKARNVIAYIMEVVENTISIFLSGIITATPHIRKRFEVINTNTIDVNNYPIVDEFLDINPNWDIKENTICYVGGITRVRGIIELAKAAPKINANLVVAGSILEDDTKNEIQNIPGSNEIRFMGQIDRIGVIEVYKNSKIGVVTLHPIINYVDSLPVKMFEYMAAGLPVVCSDFPLWNEIVVKNRCGKSVDPNSPEDIAVVVNEILNNGNEAIEMGKRGRELVLSNYNWNIEEKKLIQFYKNFT